MEESVKIFIDKIKSAKNIAIMGHKNPDGDSYCSVLALAKLIEINYGVRPTCVYDGNIPEYLDEMPMRSWIKYYERVDLAEVYDLVILLDYGTPKHIGGAKPLVDNARFIVEIDHHQNDEKLGMLCIDDENAAAVGQIIFEIMKSANWQFDKDVLDLLAVAIITDTGNFKFVRDGRVMQIMAEMVESGVVLRHLFEALRNKPRKSVVAESGAASRAQFLFKGRLAIAIVPHKDYKYLDGRGDTVLNLLGSIKGVEYIALLKEQKENQTGVSLRSRGQPVNHIAEALGGGGHMCAAGAVVNDSVENVRNRIVELFQGELK
ncbi:MAG: DHH family phosphoesterase [Alphaproteobacteria bacterium]|nr:DHH family phosphoesterase [Alphaproteobacteria bacterium]MBQ8729400.1 DHH family phosphoesterase [Alphaproteobacteria bacterium]